MKKMTILQVLPALNVGGVEEGALAISNALVRAGCRSLVVSAGGIKVADLEDQGATHFTLSLNKKNPLLFLSQVRKLEQIIRNEKVDIVHARSRWPAWCAYFAAKRCRIPFMTTFHGHHKASNWIKKFYNSVMVRTRDTIAVSRFMEKYIRDTYKTTMAQFGTQLHVIPRGVDHKRFDPDTIPDHAIASLQVDWGVPEQTPVILLPARLTRIKGHEIFLNALSLMTETAWFAVILGAPAEKTEYQRELESMIEASGLKDKVSIQPAMSNMPLAYAASDIIVCSNTQPEAFGRVVIEAQAMGKPIVASRIGEPASLIIQGKTGWLFESGNSVCLAGILQDILAASEEEKLKYSKESRATVLKYYTADLMCERTLAVYEGVLKSS